MKTTDKLIVLLYNIALLAGASYLIVAYDFSPWIYIMTLFFGASWSEKEKA